jgi:tetratricopeptide (TPR) repeat protein
MPQDPFELLQKANMSQAEKSALENEIPDALAAIYGTIGNILSGLGNFENGKKYFEQSLKISEQLAATNSFYNEWVATTQNNLGILLCDMGRFEDAKIRYEQALKMYEALLNKGPKNVQYQSDVAMTQNNLGALLKDMGRFEDAKLMFEQALKIYEALLNKDSENAQYQSYVATTQNNLGTLLRHIGRLRDAKIGYEQALKMYEALLNKDPENAQYQSYVATTQNNLGTLLKDMGRFDDTKIRYEQALEMYEALLNTNPENTQYQSDVAMTQNNLGALLKDMGRFEDAKFRYEQALKMHEALLKKDHENAQYQSNVARTQNNLGALLSDMGRLEDAKFKCEQALNMREALLNKDPENAQYQLDVAGTQNNLGVLLTLMGRLGDAKFRFVQALNMRERLLKADPENAQYHSYVAITQNALGVLLTFMMRLEDAKFRFVQALNMREALLKTDPENAQYQSDVAMTQNNLGALLKDMGRFEDAKFRFEQALKICEALLNKDSENAQYQSYLATTQNNLGSLLTDEGNLSEALDYHSKALNLVSLSGNPDLVSRIFYSRGKSHEKMGNLKQAYEDYRESIERIERIRSQFSLEADKLDILRGKAGVYSDMISLLCIKENNAGRAWAYVGRAKSRTLLDYLRLIELPVPQSIPKDLQSKEKELLESIRIRDRQARTTEKADQAYLLSQEIAKLQSERGNLYDQMVDFAPEYVDLRKGKPLPIDGIKDILKTQSKKTAFVEYYTTPEKVFIFVMRSGDIKPNVKIVDMSSQQLIGYVMRYFNEIVNFPYMPEVKETWQELADYLISPVLEDIDGCEMLYLIPHGLLHYLPLHALYINGKRLIERFPIAYASSLTAIKYAQRKGGEKLDSCLSMGFTPKGYEKELFEGEASLVAKLFETEPYLDINATSQLLTNAYNDVIHLSCHAYFNPKEPLKSGLLLSDRMLTVKDIFSMNIKANLLVLSACETGLNEQKPGDELIGLTRAFLYSGTRSIMVSLWSVSADSTLKLR